MPSRILLVLLAAGLCGSAFAQDGKTTSDAPRWLRKPSAAAIAKVYPDKAIQRGIAGRVVLDCVVDANGRMKDCQVASESPAEYGFGKAGMRISGDFLLTKTTPSGKSTEGTHMRIPLSFTPPPID